jgi:Putative DNA-binding domain
VLALRELQMRFVDALFGGEADVVAAQIKANGVDPAERVGIYRNNLHEGFIKALAIGFPVIERLVGADYFRQLARDFLHAHPSRAGNLHHIGAPFPQFLRERFAGSEYMYLADVAALECAHEEAILAADAEPISASALSAIDPARYAELRFHLHPACSLVRSSFPIVRIWRANQPASPADETIDLRSGGDNVLVLRTPECIEFHRLPAGDFAALEAFARGASLGTALEAAQAADASFDLGAALRRFLGLALLTGIEMPLITPAGPQMPDATDPRTRS